MGRGARNLIDGGYYHVLTRGNDKKKLFRCKQDYLYCLKVIRKYLEQLEVGILHYCIMPNHLHLLVHLRKAKDMSKFMQGVLQVYGNYFRKRYNSVGFVFQNRYKSKIIEREGYLLECARYIERNPLRAGLVTNILDYPWSSVFYYLNEKEDDIITTVNPLYLAFADDKSERKVQYQKYILEERPYEHIVDEAFRIR